MARFNADRAATILAEAALTSDAEVSKKWNVNPRSLHNWRERLDQDSLFAELFQRKRENLELNWLSDAPTTLRSAIAFIRKASQEGDPTDANQVRAVTAALETLASVMTTKQVIDIRLGESNRS